MNRLGRYLIAVVSASVLSSLCLLAFAPQVTVAACVKQLAYQDSVPQAAADGARESWVARTVNATDWAAGGFASEVLWVGTNGKQADVTWVEIGSTDGWQGQNIKVFYTAHAINYPDLYDEQAYAIGATLGTAYTFTVKKDTALSNTYDANITWGTHFQGITWSGHAPDTVDYSGGLEATCGTSQVNRTYVSQSQFKNKATQAWVTTNNGVLVDQTSVSGAGIAWCSSPVTFRYWLNSSIGTGLCS